ncbi:hypothetical protein OLX23_18520 [Novosphingobium sp. JCM 18896]|nr:hypothetical protein [Novosphingobium sp. JCM 18896]
MKTILHLNLAAGLIFAAGAILPSPAWAQSDCAAQAKKRRPSLFGAEGSGGLFTRLEGALSGNRNLGTDIKDTASIGASQRMSEAASVAGCRNQDKVERTDEDADPQTMTATRQPAETATQRAARRQAEADAQYPSRMPIPAEWKTAKTAYTEFGKVRCTGCEGGYAYSGWPSWPRDEFSGAYRGDEKRLERLPIGHVHLWTSNGFAGSLTINSEERVNGFRCRKMTYRLEKDGKSAERPSLMCWGKANEYAASDGWVGVF